MPLLKFAYNWVFFEEHIKINLTKYIEDNDIIIESHHGGRKFHSTLTAKAIIDHESESNLQDDKITAIVNTDLSAAYDTVDSKMLCQK